MQKSYAPIIIALCDNARSCTVSLLSDTGALHRTMTMANQNRFELSPSALALRQDVDKLLAQQGVDAFAKSEFTRYSEFVNRGFMVVSALTLAQQYHLGDAATQKKAKNEWLESLGIASTTSFAQQLTRIASSYRKGDEFGKLDQMLQCANMRDLNKVRAECKPDTSTSSKGEGLQEASKTESEGLREEVLRLTDQIKELSQGLEKAEKAQREAEQKAKQAAADASTALIESRKLKKAAADAAGRAAVKTA
jgi:hypothetical protein